MLLTFRGCIHTLLTDTLEMHGGRMERKGKEKKRTKGKGKREKGKEIKIIKKKIKKGKETWSRWMLPKYNRSS